jgi:hypothetical protein
LDVEARLKGIGQTLPQTIVSRIKDAARFDPPNGQVSFQRATIKKVDFRDTRWDDFRSTDSAFVECDFRAARFGHAVFGSVLGQTTFLHCRFDGADMRETRPGAARFEACQFDGAKIENWLSFLAEFVECHFAGRLIGSIFSGRPWGPGADRLKPPRLINEFRRNDFREADLVDCSFVRGIDISEQQWPVSDLYISFDRAQDRIREARSIISSWGDGATRDAALLMLDVYSSAGYEEQNQVFTRRDNLTSTPPAVRATVWNLLEHL